MRIFAIEETAAAAADREPGRALVVCSPERQTDRHAGRAYAPFLTHLIATSRRLPQTRTRRRASFAEAAACYRSAGPPSAPMPGEIVRSA